MIIKTTANTPLNHTLDVLKSRRRAVLGLCAFGVVGPLLSACQSKPKLQCATKNDLSLSEHLSRKGRDYVEISKQAGKNCTNCALFKGGDQTTPSCGTCGVDGLPAHPLGYCISWAPQAT